MTGGIDALLGGIAARPSAAGASLWLGTITAVIDTHTVTVALDGSDSPATVSKGPATANTGDRVIVTRLGRTLYVLVNLTS